MQFQFESFADFWTMSGHGPFVWSAYAITFAALGYLVFSARMQRKLFIRRQRKALRIAQQINQSGIDINASDS
jgi:heme exporter protein D